MQNLKTTPDTTNSYLSKEDLKTLLMTQVLTKYPLIARTDILDI